MAGPRINLCAVLTIAVVALYVGSWAKAETIDQPSKRQSFKALQVNLIRRDSPLSPFVDGRSLSLAQRLRRAIERSNYRQRRFQSFITKSARFGHSKSYFSPVNYEEGEFLMQASIGSPGSLNLNFIADTGSDLTWTQCQPCQSCFPQPYPLYDPAHSSSFQNVSCYSNFCSAVTGKCDIGKNCSYSYGYGDGSYTLGNLSFDTFSLSVVGSNQSAHFPQIAFGCGRSQGGSFSNSTGIVGLGRGPLSFVNQIRSSISSTFSYCLGSIYNSSQVSPLILGNVPLDSSGNPVSVTPLIYNLFFPTFYYLSLAGISVAGKPVPIPEGTFDIRFDGSGGIMIDSGTTLTYLPAPAYKPFLAAL
jgi:hypothetical protein